MARLQTKYICQNCSYETAKWLGKCPECDSWDSFVEEVTLKEKPGAGSKMGGEASFSAGGRGIVPTTSGMPIPITQVEMTQQERLSSGIGEFDRVLGGGIVPGGLMLVGGDPGIGKCLAGSERVFDPCTGDYLPITQWAAKPRRVLSLQEEDARLTPMPVSAFLNQGVQSVVEVSTRLGRTLRCTSSHPVLTPKGWLPVGDLPIGTRIGSPRALPYFGTDVMDDTYVRLAAYILSDGSATSQITVTSAIAEVETDLRNLALALDMTLRVYTKAFTKAKLFRFVNPYAIKGQARQTFTATLIHLRNQKGVSWMGLARKAGVPHARLRTWYQGRCVPSQADLQRLAEALGVPLMELDPANVQQASQVTRAARMIEELGLRFSHAADKAVPEAIFRLPRTQLALFLKILFSCDGSVYVTSNQIPALSYSTISLRLAQDIQHLLLRFGFVTKLRTKPMRVNEQSYTAFELQMLGIMEVRRFLLDIGIWGRESAKERIALLPDPVLPSTHFDTVPLDIGFWQHLREASGGASFKTISTAAGVAIRNRRFDRPLCLQTVKTLAATYPTEYLQKLAQNDIYWDEIASIRPAGEENVYDLTVPVTANFVASDLIVHNSTLLSQVAYCVAAGISAQKTTPDSGSENKRGARQKVESMESAPEFTSVQNTALNNHVLYISGEESAQQIKLRSARLGAESPNFLISVETEIGIILHHLEATRPALAVIDSIQTMSDSSLDSAPGTVSQIRQCATHLARFAKSVHVPIVLIGHVTKEGNLAGPRVLEHIVDTVLYFEGDRHHTYRLLRAAKNRFGSTDELGIFEMRENGLMGVDNPSAVLLAERAQGGTGSAVASTMEGSRALLVEVQALVARSTLASPRRVVTGMDPNRVNMILAVLEKRAGLRIAEQDVFVNVAGGVRIMEPASDLATAVAIASNFREQPVEPTTILLGEVGLAGEVRAVSQVEKRLKEAARQGFTKAVISRHNTGKLPAIEGIKVVGVNNVHDAFNAALLPTPRSEA